MDLDLKNVRIHNVMRITDANLSPTTHLVVIGGRNEAGKSTILEVIKVLFEGKKGIVRQMLRDGARDGFAELTTGGPEPLRIRMEFKKGKEEPHKYEIFHAADDPKSAVPLLKPRTILESLYSKFCFNVGLFEDMSNKERIEVLVQLDPGLDFTALNDEHERVFAQRTNYNRDKKKLDGQLASMEIYHGVPEVAVDVDALMAELEGMEVEAKAHEGLERDLADAGKEYRRIQDIVAAAEEELASARLAWDESLAKGNDARAALDVSAAPDTDPIRKQISEAGDINQRIVWNEERRVAEAEADDLYDKSMALTHRLDEIAETKVQRMKDSTLGIEGLGLEDDEVTYQGLPFANASDANRRRLSMEIGQAQNPKLKLALIRDGSIFDEDAIKRLAEDAERKGCMVVLERVGNGPECSIIMVDGRIEDVTGEETGEDTTTDEGEEN